MARPQQRELARNEKVPALSPDASETELSGQPDFDERGRTGPVPEDNLPGHHREEEQDKPDGDAFLRKLQGEDRPKKAAAKKTKTKTAAARKTTAKKAAAPVKKAGSAPIPEALSDLPSGAAKTTRTPEATTSPRATTTTSAAGGVDLRDVRDVAVKLAFWPVTVGVWAGKQVLRRRQER